MRSLQKSRKESRVSEVRLAGDKKNNYREKNRIAAARCRSRKKEHADKLEDTYRTQGTMNTALKKTEKSLRHELSYWRTQTLQHTFCTCHRTQEHKLKKAQSMVYGTNYSATPPSV